MNDGFPLATNEIVQWLSEKRWRRLCLLGLAVQGVAAVTISALAYRGGVLIPVPSPFDWVAHGILIGMIAFWLDGVLAHRAVSLRIPWLGIAPTLVLVAAYSEELAQRLSPRRTSSWGDAIADTVGVVLLVALSGWIQRRLAGRGLDPLRLPARS